MLRDLTCAPRVDRAEIRLDDDIRDRGVLEGVAEAHGGEGGGAGEDVEDFKFELEVGGSEVGGGGVDVRGRVEEYEGYVVGLGVVVLVRG